MRSDAQQPFLWGAATAALQIEGAHNEEGRAPSIWDVFAAIPGKVAGGVPVLRACEHYRMWREDIRLMKEMGLNSYRFSISWPRVLPSGRGTVNAAGIEFYDRLVDELLAHRIQPLITLYHWDLPAALQMELGGWAHPDIAPIFADYAELMFKRLGDRVSMWLTLNEPWCSVDGGYFNGGHAPGAKDRRTGYRAGHNLIRAHAYAVATGRTLLPKSAKLSFALNTAYFWGATNSREDSAAADRALLNMAGWFGDPMWYGDYPAVMRERLGDQLPAFSEEDARLLRKSMDYIAINYYFSERVRHAPGQGFGMDIEPVAQPERKHTAMGWPITPDGFAPLLRWLDQRYGHLPLYVTENGGAFDDEPDANGYVNDQNRIEYYDQHLRAVKSAMDDGVDVRGYFAWTLMDNLEWSLGLSKRFGLIRTDFSTLKRTPKASARWYSQFIREGGLSALPAADEPAVAAARV